MSEAYADLRMEPGVAVMVVNSVHQNGVVFLELDARHAKQGVVDACVVHAAKGRDKIRNRHRAIFPV
jgi:hypothetical protein